MRIRPFLRLRLCLVWWLNEKKSVRTYSFREIGVSRHNGDQIRTPPFKPLNTIVMWCTEGFEGRAQVVPHDAERDLISNVFPFPSPLLCYMEFFSPSFWLPIQVWRLQPSSTLYFPLPSPELYLPFIHPDFWLKSLVHKLIFGLLGPYISASLKFMMLFLP